ncbi:MAG TPA: cellulose binding domain-containing protein [Polyangiaceae bacterium]|jgi:hypothetical protein|nr:cellulose binding domain-containing protein [Polyangiaceae bacterium]
MRRTVDRRTRAVIAFLATCSVAACSLTSLDQYFRCPPNDPTCLDSAGAGTLGADASAGAGGDLVSASGSGGAAGSAIAMGGQSGEQAGQAGALGEAGSNGLGAPCETDRDCGSLVCYRTECAFPYEILYADQPDPKDPANDTKWIKFWLEIANHTANAALLQDFKVRYYFSPEGVEPVFQVLSAASFSSDSDIIGEFSPHGSSMYVEISFTSDAGSLKADEASGLLELGISDQNFSATFSEPGDYSYDPLATDPNVLHSWDQITLYYRGALVFGKEP